MTNIDTLLRMILEQEATAKKIEELARELLNEMDKKSMEQSKKPLPKVINPDDYADYGEHDLTKNGRKP